MTYIEIVVKYIRYVLAVVAELAYALDSGSSPGNWVGVQVPLTALIASVYWCFKVSELL